nr:MAG TPA: hypothetical protein [Caudoviricetes sp.]
MHRISVTKHPRGCFYYVQNMKTEKALENTHIWR